MSKTASALEFLTKSCRKGYGTPVRNFGQNRLPEWINEILSDSGQIIMIPYSTTCPVNAIQQERFGVYHAPCHFRSFEICSPGADEMLVVKGGDLFHSDALLYNWTRAANGQIPGSGTRERLLHESDAAFNLREQGDRLWNGEIALPLPLSIRQIKSVMTPESEVPIHAYLNSDAYLNLAGPYVKNALCKDGQMFAADFAEKGIYPCVYLYTVDCNIRSNEAASYLFDDSFNAILGDNRFAGSEDGICKLGVFIEDEMSKYQIISGVYRTLARIYKFNFDDLAIPDAVSENNYWSVLNNTWRIANSTGIAEDCIRMFLKRVIAVAVTGHSLGLSFSTPLEPVGGSLVARNVTISGVVLDLDTVTPIGEDGLLLLKKDISELALSVGCFVHLFGLDINLPWLNNLIVRLYKETVSCLTDVPPVLDRFVSGLDLSIPVAWQFE